MKSLFRTTRNTRQLIKGDSRYIRSDVPMALTADEIQWLADEGVYTIIDLREEAEQAAKPCSLKNDPRFDYLSMPVTGGNAVPEKPEDVAASYIAMCDEQMQRIIDRILCAQTNVLYFCNAGKDRTGVVSAILLHTLGYDDEYIVSDYLMSGENLKDALLAYAQSQPQVDIDVITPHKEYILEFLEWYKSRD